MASMSSWMLLLQRLQHDCVLSVSFTPQRFHCTVCVFASDDAANDSGSRRYCPSHGGRRKTNLKKKHLNQQLQFTNLNSLFGGRTQSSLLWGSYCSPKIHFLNILPLKNYGSSNTTRIVACTLIIIPLILII